MSDRFDCFKTKVLHPRVKYLDSVDSTNTEAKRLFLKGETEGLIIIAKQQISGRGRKDRIWLSPIGGLYFTLLLKPRLDIEGAPLLGFLSACAVARSLEKLGIKRVWLKWPNDVLIGERKIAGILSEIITTSDETTGILIGIGINQNCPISDMPPGLQWPTTSIIDELGEETSIEALLCSVVNEVDILLQGVVEASSFAKILDEWRDRSSTLGVQVRIHEEGATIDGVAIDIGEDGSLIVETETGIMHVLLGDVSHLRSKE